METPPFQWICNLLAIWVRKDFSLLLVSVAFELLTTSPLKGFSVENLFNLLFVVTTFVPIATVRIGGILGASFLLLDEAAASFSFAPVDWMLLGSLLCLFFSPSALPFFVSFRGNLLSKVLAAFSSRTTHGTFVELRIHAARLSIRVYRFCALGVEVLALGS